jgi:NAD(P)-dependent dehydrogenase (short-subunit alcohol dehydrogenase family)
MKCDVFHEDQVQAAIAETIRHLGHIDILVNNAGGGGHHGPLATETSEEFEQIIKLNLRSVWYGMRYALPHMIERRYGRIVNDASQLAHKPAPGNASYCATKAAVVALSSAVAYEVADYGITVNCVCPGPTDTPLWRSYPEDWRQWKVNSLPIKRVSMPEEQAWAFVYVASDEAAYLTGQSISPNGGDVMW